MERALDDLTVLDISTTPAGAWCSRLLADFGADVLVAEPPGGSPLRQLEPLDSDGKSIPAEYWLANKRSRVIDRTTAEGRAELVDLARRAHVLVSSASPAELQTLGLHYEDIGSARLVMVHVTPYGVVGPLAGQPANDLSVAARSGWASINGFASREPLKPSGWQASYCGGVAAFIAVLAALHEREITGLGQEIDVSTLDAMLAAYAPAFLRAQYTDEPLMRKESGDLLAGPVPVKDGYFALTLSRAQFWRDAMNLLELPDLAEDPRWEASWYRQAHKDEYIERVTTQMAKWKKSDLFDELAARRVVAGPVLTMEELSENEHLAGRGFWQETPGGKVFPGAPAKLSETPWEIRKGAPGPGEDKSETRWPTLLGRSPAPKSGRVGPLEGIQGIVLTQAWAGTFCTELLGFLGADIVQVEVRKRFDSWRGEASRPMGEKLDAIPTAQHPWNTHFLYNSVNLNKRCVTLDLQEERGRDVFLDLVKHADVVAENFSPRVMGNLGIGHDVLRAINPGIILCSLSAYGHDGPWANVPGIGGTIEPSSGMSALLGYEDGPPMNSGQMYPDAVAGYYGAASILAALRYRDRTGRGQFVDLSMMEANLAHTGDAALEYLRNGTQRARMGNRHTTFAPHGIYRCAGDEQWIAIACETDEQWRALLAVAGGAIEGVEGWQAAAGRKSSEASLDAALSAWTAGQNRDALVESLVTAGVIAAPVLDGLELADDVSARERGILVDIEHVEVGHMQQLASPFRFGGSDPVPIRPAPLHGEHSLEVFQQFLGMSEEEYAALVAAGITGMGPPDQVEEQAHA